MGRTARTWLSKGPEMLQVDAALGRKARRRQKAADPDLDCDVLIVGSGYGASVAAARLAGRQVQEANGQWRPARIWLVERGREHLPGGFAASFGELPGQLRFSQQDGLAPKGDPEALLDAHLGSQVSVLLANGLGGGSLINAGVMLRPEDSVFQSGWPGALTQGQDPALAAAYDAALQMLQPAPVPQALQTPKLHGLQRLSSQQAVPCPVTLNWADTPQTSAAGVTLNPCTRCGDCLTGCNQGAKGSLDTSYLAWAAARGVPMYCGIAVTHLRRAGDTPGAGWQVYWDYTDPKRRRSDGQVPVLRARRVVLAAGALGSTEILLRSRQAQADDLAPLVFSDALGRGFSTNGDRIVGGLAQGTPPVHACASLAHPDPVGPTITGRWTLPPDTATNRPGFTVQELAVPAALHAVFGETVATLAALDQRPLPGGDPCALSDALTEQFALYGLMGDDGARVGPAGQARGGRLHLPGVAPDHPRRAVESSLAIAWDGEPLRTTALYKRMNAWLEAIPPTMATLSPAPGAWWTSRSSALTVHPLGGCGMADDAGQGVVDDCGRVFSGAAGTDTHEGLVVLDGAIVPRALGINPALTITALAERALPLLLAGDWAALQTADHSPAMALAARPAPPAPAPATSPRPTVWRIQERLIGPATIDGQAYWAALRLRVAPIAGFRALLAQSDRRLAFEQAELKLWRSDRVRDPLDDPRALEAEPPTQVLQCSGELGFFEPVASRPDAEGERHCVLRYALRIDQVGPAGANGPLALGQGLHGHKTFGETSEQIPGAGVPGPLRQLSELPMYCDGQAQPLGTWQFDMDEMAQQEAPLLQLMEMASMPDALCDLAGLALYLLRHLPQSLVMVLMRSAIDPLDPDARHDRFSDDTPAALNQRLPGPIRMNGQDLAPVGWAAVGAHGARLTHYKPSDAGWRPTHPPVLLVHGLGTSGASFTHPAIGVPLAACLLQQGREVWVLDLRSSIGNEAHRHDPDADAWTVDQIADTELVEAIDQVYRANGQQPIDLVAHCMGAVMFCIATLGHARLAGQLHAVVLSQVGPLLRLSPYNRARGYLGAYLRQFTPLQELDTRPDAHPIAVDGGPPPRPSDWRRRAPEGALHWITELLAAYYPYPDGDPAAHGVPGSFHHPEPRRRQLVRQRADAMFGQLFEAGQLNDATLGQLDALLGWVKVNMLAQGIHFARHNLVTNAHGRNVRLQQANLATRMAFPLMIVHGRRNRVFHWRGSLDSWAELARVRQQEPAVQHFRPAPGQAPDDASGWQHHGLGSATQLLLLDRYGHLDTLIGARAHLEVFPRLLAFLNDPPQMPRTAAPRQIEVEQPWIGPMLGWLRHTSTSADAPAGLRARLLVQPSPRRASTQALALVPVQPIPAAQRQAGAAVWTADLARTRFLPWPETRGGGAEGLADSAPSENVFDLDWPFTPRAQDQTDDDSHWLLLTVHADLALPRPRDLNLGSGLGMGLLAASTGGHLLRGRAWTAGAARPFKELDPHEARQQIAKRLPALLAREWPAGLLRLSAAVRAAADTLQPRPGPTRLCFALGSCQYPPGLMDAHPAGAAYRRLAAQAQAESGESARGNGEGGWTPQFLVLAGDQVYADATAGVFEPAGLSQLGTARTQDDDLNRSYELNWRLPPLRQTSALLPLLPMLDDHEVRDNWHGHKLAPAVEQGQNEAALRAYHRHQGVLAPDTALSEAGQGPAETRSWSARCHPAGLPFILLDTRSQRYRRQALNVGRSSMLHPDDQRALFSALEDAAKDRPLSPFFIVSPSPLLPDERFQPGRWAERMASDTWSGFPRARARLLRHIRDLGLRRVVFLSGDSHLSLVSRLHLDPAPGSTGAPVPVLSIVSSGLYAPWPFANQRLDELVLDGRVSLGQPRQPCDGRIETLARSTRAGHALIALQTERNGQACLQVRLVPADGSAEQHCTLTLD